MSINSNELGYSESARDTALQKAKQYLQQTNPDRRKGLFVVVNMDEPSYKERFYIYDETREMFTGNYHVAHGMGSSDPNNAARAIKFGNVPDSEETSIGGMLTCGIYNGKHGPSLRIKGLDKGINDNSFNRFIEIHAASYVTQDFILKNGYAGRSWGCFAISPNAATTVIPLLAGNVFLFVHHSA